MLAQTNLQLYRQMIDANCADQELQSVRAAYNLACELFVGSHRPSQKPFTCHLVGTASALFLWNEPIEMVTAGLLHSAYLYGTFGDGTRGITEGKRRTVRNRIGPESEALIGRYTQSSHTVLLDALSHPEQRAELDRNVILLKLADLCDDLLDAGPLYSPHKRLMFGLPGDSHARKTVVEVAEEMIGPIAARHFRKVFLEIDSCRVPASLIANDSGSRTLTPGVDQMRQSKFRQRLTHWNHRMFHKRAA